MCKPFPQCDWLALRLVPQFSYMKRVMRFLQWEDLLRPIWQPKWKSLWSNPYPPTPFVYPLRSPRLNGKLLLFCHSSQCSLMCVSCPEFFQPPFSLIRPLFIDFPLVGLLWWWKGFLGKWDPFWDIFLTRWGPLLKTYVTVLKLTLATN